MGIQTLTKIFSGSEDERLPDNIKKKPAIMRRAFVKAFNSTLKECMKEGKSEADCEGTAFAVGNAAADNAGGKDIKSQMAEDMAKINGVPPKPETLPEVKAVDIPEPIPETVSDTKLAEDELGNLTDYVDPRLTQPEANYNPVGGDGVKACANCRWFDGYTRCTVVQGMVSPTGISDLWLAVKEVPEPEPEPEPEIEPDAVITIIEAFMDKSGHTKETIWQKVKSFFMAPTPKLFATETGFKVLSDNRFVAWYTNSYKDRDGETFTLKSIEDDTNRMFKSGDMPPLWFWHIKGTEHGKTEWIGTIGRFAVAIGTFHDTPMAKEFKKLYEKGSYSLSHGFFYNPENLINGVYHEYKTFEISALPNDRAANQYTKFALSNGEKKAMNAKQFKALEQALGTDDAIKIVAEGKDASKALDEAGVEYKEKETEPETESVKEENPLEARLEAIENGFKDLTAFIAEMKADKKEDDEDEDEDENSEHEDEKQDNTPDGQKSLLTDDMKTGLIREMEANVKRGLQEKQLAELAPADQILVKSGFGQYLGIE